MIQRISLLLLLAAVCIQAFHLHRSIIRTTTQLYSEAPQFKNFDDMLSRIEVPVLVDFYAQWCGPCVMMQPVLETLASRLGDEARVAKVDTDKSPRLGSRYQIEALPTLVLFHKGDIILSISYVCHRIIYSLGREVERYVGYRSAEELEREVRAVGFSIMFQCY